MQLRKPYVRQNERSSKITLITALRTPFRRLGNGERAPLEAFKQITKYL